MRVKRRPIKPAQSQPLHQRLRRHAVAGTLGATVGAVIGAVGTLGALHGPASALPPVASPPAIVSGQPDTAEGSFSLPDSKITPGVVRSVDARVVCVSGYTKTVRQGLTHQERDLVDKAYGWTYAPGAQEYDHLIPLELGGDNGPQNIWPQPIGEAKIKDRLENALHAEMCAGRATIEDVQGCIRVDWVACWRREGEP